jgi:Flp pilus assembly protein CpaB
VLLMPGSNKSGPRGRGLLATRRGTILVAVGAAILAASVLFVFISNYRDSVANEGEGAKVLVADGLIQKGSSGDVLATERMFRTATVRVDQLRPGAVTDPAVLRQRIAQRDILPGQQLIATDFATAGPGLPDKLAGHQRAMGISVDGVHGLDGPLRIGDRVDVYAAFGTTNAGIGIPVIKKIVDDAMVLRPVRAQGTKAAEGGAVGVERGVVLRVPSRLVPKVALTSDVGRIWLVARPGAGVREAPDEIVSIESVLFGKDASSIEKQARRQR